MGAALNLAVIAACRLRVVLVFMTQIRMHCHPQGLTRLSESLLRRVKFLVGRSERELVSAKMKRNQLWP